jgi:hypothetical protein
MLTCFFACFVVKQFMYLFFDDVVLPFREKVINKLPFGKISGQHPPMVAFFEQIKDSILKTRKECFLLRLSFKIPLKSIHW